LCQPAVEVRLARVEENPHRARSLARGAPGPGSVGHRAGCSSRTGRVRTRGAARTTAAGLGGAARHGSTCCVVVRGVCFNESRAYRGPGGSIERTAQRRRRRALRSEPRPTARPVRRPGRVGVAAPGPGHFRGSRAQPLGRRDGEQERGGRQGHRRGEGRCRVPSSTREQEQDGPRPGGASRWGQAARGRAAAHRHPQLPTGRDLELEHASTAGTGRAERRSGALALEPLPASRVGRHAAKRREDGGWRGRRDRTNQRLPHPGGCGSPQLPQARRPSRARGNPERAGSVECSRLVGTRVRRPWPPTAYREPRPLGPAGVRGLPTEMRKVRTQREPSRRRCVGPRVANAAHFPRQDPPATVTSPSCARTTPSEDAVAQRPEEQGQPQRGRHVTSATPGRRGPQGTEKPAKTNV